MKNFKTTLLALSLCSLGLSSAHATTEASSRIINGSQSGSDSWPFMTALVFKNVNAYDGQFCGGSYIGGRYILTAAHCVTSNLPEEFDVVIGKSNLSENNVDSSRYSVSRVYVPDFYSSYSFPTADLAILELTHEPSAIPIQTADKFLRNNLVVGEVLTVMGWGDQDPDRGSVTTSSNLFQVDVPLVDQGVCSSAMSDEYQSIQDGEFCAGYKSGGKDSCQGDSGGPIIVKSGNQYEQLGIVSWGDGCAEPNVYGVYTNLSHFTDWITDTTLGLSYRQEEYLGPKLLGQYRHTFSLSNKSDQAIQIDDVQHNYYANIESDTCSNNLLSAGASCDVTVSYNVEDDDEHDLEIYIDSGSLIYESITMKARYRGTREVSVEVGDYFDSISSDVYSNSELWSVDNGTISMDNISIGSSHRIDLVGVPKGTVVVDVAFSSANGSGGVNLYRNGEYYKTIDRQSPNSEGVPLLKETGNEVSIEFDNTWSDAVSSESMTIRSVAYSDDIKIGKMSDQGTSRSGSSGGGLGWFVPVVLLFLANRRRK